MYNENTNGSPKAWAYIYFQSHWGRQKRLIFTLHNLDKLLYFLVSLVIITFFTLCAPAFSRTFSISSENDLRSCPQITVIGVASPVLYFILHSWAPRDTKNISIYYIYLHTFIHTSSSKNYNYYKINYNIYTQMKSKL